MAQLKMYFLPGTKTERSIMPKGYGISGYRGPEDKYAWAACCRPGLVGPGDGAEIFDLRIGPEHERDVLFLDFQGERVGTVTPIYHQAERIGEVHMVGIRPDVQGRGLSRLLNQAALDALAGKDCRYVYLTTDEWRQAAVKSYLKSGFLPVDYDAGMPGRWESLLAALGIAQAEMVDDQGGARRVIRPRREEGTVDGHGT